MKAVRHPNAAPLSGRKSSAQALSDIGCVKRLREREAMLELPACCQGPAWRELPRASCLEHLPRPTEVMDCRDLSQGCAPLSSAARNQCGVARVGVSRIIGLSRRRALSHGCGTWAEAGKRGSPVLPPLTRGSCRRAVWWSARQRSKH